MAILEGFVINTDLPGERGPTHISEMVFKGRRGFTKKRDCGENCDQFLTNSANFIQLRPI